MVDRVRQFPRGHSDLRAWVAVDPKPRRAALKEALGLSHSAVCQMLNNPPGMTPQPMYWQPIEVLTSGVVKAESWRLPADVERERGALVRAAQLQGRFVVPAEAGASS